ncbi:LysR family transcriptional regulator [bacterium]|nr:LysR family transcriptional regulator [bacterium]MBU1073829.1 LysR family transcriptional regulator [bacterium]MBU1674932.1 LysR family transcriptional regulator [bacterium]
MHLSTSQLEAFHTAAKLESFTKAASRLHLTQSALSQRIRKLEDGLETCLFVRAPGGIRLTEAGQRLLQYCRDRETLDTGLAGDLGGAAEGGLSGALRIAGYSSVMRSAVVPALGPLLRGNPGVHCEFFVREMGELPGMLKRAEAEFVVVDRALDWRDVITHTLGREEYVAIESATHRTREDVYLDHDPEDHATHWFFRDQPDVPRYRRSYMGDVYGILDGVAHGLGRAVMSRHLIGTDSGVRILPQYEPCAVDVVLHRYTECHASRLHAAALEALQAGCPGYLGMTPD